MNYFYFAPFSILYSFPSIEMIEKYTPESQGTYSNFAWNIFQYPLSSASTSPLLLCVLKVLSGPEREFIV